MSLSLSSHERTPTSCPLSLMFPCPPRTCQGPLWLGDRSIGKPVLLVLLGSPVDARVDVCDNPGEREGTGWPLLTKADGYLGSFPVPSTRCFTSCLVTTTLEEIRSAYTWSVPALNVGPPSLCERGRRVPTLPPLHPTMTLCFFPEDYLRFPPAPPPRTVSTSDSTQNSLLILNWSTLSEIRTLTHTHTFYRWRTRGEGKRSLSWKKGKHSWRVTEVH